MKLIQMFALEAKITQSRGSSFWTLAVLCVRDSVFQAPGNDFLTGSADQQTKKVRTPNRGCCTSADMQKRVLRVKRGAQWVLTVSWQRKKRSSYQNYCIFQHTKKKLGGSSDILDTPGKQIRGPVPLAPRGMACVHGCLPVSVRRVNSQPNWRLATITCSVLLAPLVFREAQIPMTMISR